MSPDNIAASVKARLQNTAKKNNQIFNELLQRYAMERFLYRLSKSNHADKFILKGALLFMTWGPDYHRRTTLDIDLLGFTENSLKNLRTIAEEICNTEVEEDGIHFDSTQIQLERIKEDADYAGVRIRTFSYLEKSRVPIQIDIGFGDALVPGSIPATLPTLLDFPAPHLNCYHQLTAIAEKFQAMVRLGELNSRMKDFYDIWTIIQNEDINGAELHESCIATFRTRNTPLDTDSRFFSDDFSQAFGKETLWAAFVRKQGLADTAPEKFSTVVELLHAFFKPMVNSHAANKTFSAHWTASQRWVAN